MGRRDLSCALFVFALLALLSPRDARAHEFWIEPSTFFATRGDSLRVRLFVGDLGTAGQGDEIARRPDLILRFAALSHGVEKPIGGIDGRAPAGLLRLDRAGYATLLYRSRHSFIELPPERFESYLEDEGLQQIVAARQRSGDSLTPGRESYARYCKSLVYVAPDPESPRATASPGSGAGAVAAPSSFDQEVGLPIELIPESDPALWRDGDALSFKLLYERLPLSEQQVKLIHLDEPAIRLVGRTDAEGRVTFHPPDGGRYLAATVYMRPAPEGVEGDWESFWGSLSFATPRGPA